MTRFWVVVAGWAWLLGGVVVLTISIGEMAFGQTVATWTNANPGDLLDGANWSGGIAPNGIDAVATFSTLPTGGGDFVLNAPLTLGTLDFSNAAHRHISISGVGSLTFQSSSGTALFSSSGGGMHLAFGTQTGALILQSTTEFRHEPQCCFDITYPISGPGGLIKTGNGIVRLAAMNSYSGATTISGGTLSGNSIANAGSDSAFGRGDFEIANGGTLQYTGGSVPTNRNVALSSGDGIILVDVAASRLTLNGNVTGPGNLVKGGTGTLELRNSSNSYGGATNVFAGTLQTNTSHVIPNGSGVMVAGGAVLDLGNNSDVVGSLAGAGQVIIDGGNLTAGGDNSSTAFSGVLSGSGDLTKIGSGTMTLSGNNSYNGPTTINGGTLSGASIANSGTNSSFGAGSAIALSGGGTLQYTGGNVSTDRAVSLGAGGGTIHLTNSLTLTGLISGSGTLTKNGPGTLHITGANTYSGGTVIVENSFTVTNATGSATGTGDVTVGPLANLGIGAGGTTGFVSGNIVNNNVVNFSRSNNITYGGIISGTGEIEKEGAGTLTFTGAHTYAGRTLVNVGTLRIGAAERLPDGSAVNVASGATLDLNNFNETIGSLAGGGFVTLGSGTLTTGGNNTTTSFTGDITGSGGLTKTGSGILYLSGNNTYAGLNRIQSGTLSGDTIGNIGTSKAFGYGSFEISNGATLQYTGISKSTDRTINLLGSGSGSGGAIDVATSGTELTLTSVVSGSGNFTKKGLGTLTLSSTTNNYGGSTSITDGTLKLGAAGVIPDGSAVTVNANKTFDVNNFNETVGSLTGGGAVTLGSGTLTTGGNNATTQFDGTISGSGGLTKSGSGTMTLTGNNTHSGGTTIAGGTLQLGTGGTTGSLSSASAITNNGILTVNRSNAVTQGTDFGSAPISGTGSFVQAGTGTTTLTAANTYAGGTTVNSGRLLVNNTTGSGTGTGPVIVNNAGVLGGSGVISGGVTLNHTATLAPGNSPGTLTISGNLTLGAGSTSAFELNGADTTIGGGVNDLVDVGGNLALDGTLNVTEAVAGSFASAVPGNKWRLYNYGGTLTNNGLDLGTLPAPANSHWAYQIDTATANQVNLNLINTVPATFTGIGDLTGGTVSSTANAVSADGTTVVGQSNSVNGAEAYRWTNGGGIVGLGDLPGGTFNSVAYGVSGDGTVIVGSSSAATPAAFRWTAGTGMNSLNLGTSDAAGITTDGSTIVGNATGSGAGPFRWTVQDGAIGVPGIQVARAVSSGGNAVAGNVNISSQVQAAIWTQDRGFEMLGNLAGGTDTSFAMAISTDGRAAVGQSGSVLGNEAFRWTRETGIRPLGDLPGGSFGSGAFGVSEGGGAVVGFGSTAAGQRAFYWDALSGMQELQPYLAAEFGLVMPGWTLTEARAITPDGRVIVGNGTNPAGQQEGWKVDLSQIVGVSWIGGSDNWDTGGSWKYGWHPRAHDPIALTPAAGAVVTGPEDATTVHSITVDATTGTTELRLQNDFTATAGITVEAGGRITLAGQQLDAGSGLVINGAGRVQGYGIVYGPISGSTGAAGVLSATRSLALTQPLVVGSRQARVLSTGVANLGPDASLAGGSITAPNGLFVGGGNLLHGHGTVNARVSAGIGSLIAAEGGNLTIGSATSPAGFFSDGDLTTGTNTVTINDANDAVLGSLTTLGDGVNDGTLVAGTAFTGDTRTHFLIEQGKNLVGRGHVVGNVKNHGSVIGDGPSLVPNERIVFDAGWKVSGIGDFANVLFNGTFAPGLSPGVVAGSDLAIGGTLEIELGGATAGNGIGHHDQVNDASVFTIAAGAALALQPYGGFLPTLGQEFTIVTAAAGFAGEFANVTVDPWFWQHGIDFQLSTTSSALVITAVAPHLSGDFNLDGSVDAADYVVWRHGLGTTYSQADLADWRANFGKSFSTGSAFDNAAVPEPSVMAAALLAIAGFASQRRRNRNTT